VPKIFARHKNWIIVAGVFAIVLILCSTHSFFIPIRCATVRVIAAPFNAYHKIKQYAISKERVNEDNRALRKRTGDLSLEVARLSDIRDENERLRELLQFKKNFGFNTISAEIIAREPNDWTRSFIIDRGTRDGIKPQTAVCSAKGLVGKVVESGADTSFVTLLTHPNFKAGGVIKGSRINGVVVGNGKEMAKIIYIPLDAYVEKGSIVMTSGLSRIFPKGILIGEVVSAHKSKTGLYKYAIIKPFANFFDEEEVLCIIE